MFTRIEFQVTGAVVELRELQSSKNPQSTWRGYLIKLAALGETAEINVDERQYRGVTVGQAVHCRGHLSTQGGRQRLEATHVLDASVVAPAQASAANAPAGVSKPAVGKAA